MTPEFTVRVAVAAALLLKMMEFAVALAVTVTEAPARITALSVLAGTTPPDQVRVLVQLPPDAVVSLVAPWVADAPKNVTNVTRIKSNFFSIVSKINSVPAGRCP
ncbi:MAG: hypothetical protein ACLQAH_01905 [Limisphaerales bacterium]